MSDVTPDEARANLRDLSHDATDTAGTIDAAFARAGESLSRSLARAASDGKVSLKELASVVISAVDAADGETKTGGLGNVLSTLFSAATSSFSGARADGGPVVSGGAYLVGERGPEVFRPAISGSVEATNSGANVTVNLTVAGGVSTLVRSEAQVAAAIQRAARMGLR